MGKSRDFLVRWGGLHRELDEQGMLEILGRMQGNYWLDIGETGDLKGNLFGKLKEFFEGSGFVVDELLSELYRDFSRETAKWEVMGLVCLVAFMVCCAGKSHYKFFGMMQADPESLSLALEVLHRVVQKISVDGDLQLNPLGNIKEISKDSLIEELTETIKICERENLLLKNRQVPGELRALKRAIQDKDDEIYVLKSQVIDKEELRKKIRAYQKKIEKIDKYKGEIKRLREIIGIQTYENNKLTAQMRSYDTLITESEKYQLKIIEQEKVIQQLSQELSSARSFDSCTLDSSFDSLQLSYISLQSKYSEVLCECQELIQKNTSLEYQIFHHTHKHISQNNIP